MRIRPIARPIQEALPDFGYLPFAASGADAAFAVQTAVPELARVRTWAQVVVQAVPESARVQAQVQVPAMA